MSRIFAALLVLLASFATAAQAPSAQPAKPTRVLFIGNSLTSVSDIPGRLAALAKVMGRVAHVESYTANGYSLADHWQDGRALAEIRKGWDIVVLQQGTSGRADSAAELLEYTKRFAGPIREAGARPALYMVWPLQDRQYEFPEAIGAYRAAAQAVDGILIPAGEAWLRALSKDKKLRLYGDAIHPSSIGSDLTVLTIYLALFPAGPQEFDQKFVDRIAAQLEIQPRLRDAFFDAATLAIDQPLRLK
jgi:hypothetical protein